MLRKKGCVPSALTQNVKDLLASREIENILDVNTAIFRTNSVTSKGNMQFIAYYDEDGYLTLGKRRLGCLLYTSRCV